jgi:hypothetical protein
MEIEAYVDYITESRRRGFSDSIIKKSLLDKGWPERQINLAFHYIENINKAYHSKGIHKQGYNKKIMTNNAVEIIESNQKKGDNQVTLFLEDDLLNLLEKRAKKNMMTVSELVEDILRRSTLNQKNKKSIYDGKIDDKLVGIFSRKRTGPKKKK